MTDQLIQKKNFHSEEDILHAALLNSFWQDFAIKSPNLFYMSCPNQFIHCLPFSCPTYHLGGCSRNIKHSHFLFLCLSFHSYFIEPFSMHVISSSNSSESCFSVILLNMLACQYLINHACGSCLTQCFIL